MGLLNQFKTVVLLGLLSALLVFIGSLFGPDGLVIGLIFAVVMNVGSYFYSDKLVLSMYRAKQISKGDNKYLYEIVENLSRKVKIPVPKIYIIESKNPNAFATGRNPNHSAVACTSGILEILKKDELEAVIAHELGHIKNRDILIATIAATVASVISYIAMMARWAAIFGGMGGNDDRRGNGLELLFLAILTPIIATILQLAISRSREFLADEFSAKATKNPKSLISALKKISDSSKLNPMRLGSKATASLFISNPFKGENFSGLFSTHPPLEKRIEHLESLRNY